MKRIVALMGAALVLLCVLTGCGSKTFDKELVLEDVYQKLLDAQGEKQGELVLFSESDPGYFDSFYPGLTGIELAQQVYYIAPVAGAACEVLMVETAQAKDVSTVKEIFQARIDRAAADTVYPDVAQMWASNARVQSAGNYVAMIALPDGCVLPENVFRLE